MAADIAAQERLTARFQRWLDVPQEQARVAAVGRDGDSAAGMALTERSARKLSRLFGMSESNAARAMLTDPRGRHIR